MKVWVVELEKNVSINISIPKQEGITEETAIAMAFDELGYDDRKNYEFKSIWEDVV